MYENYRKLRDERGLKDAAVAKGTGLSHTVFSEWKHGKATPKTDKLQKIARFLGVSIDDLTGWYKSEPMEYSFRADYRNAEDYELARELNTIVSQLDHADAEEVLRFARYRLSESKYKKVSLEGGEVV